MCMLSVELKGLSQYLICLMKSVFSALGGYVFHHNIFLIYHKCTVDYSGSFQSSLHVDSLAVGGKFSMP